MNLRAALLPFLFASSSSSSSSSSHDDNVGTSASSLSSSSASSSAAYGSEKKLNDPQQNMKLRLLHDPSPSSELTNRQDHRINGDGSTGSDASKKHDIGRLDHDRVSKDRHSDEDSQRQRELESREEYCGNLCSSGRQEIQDNGTAFKSLINSGYDASIGCWNTSAVTDMSEAFRSMGSFNEQLNCWDVSNVTNMMNMFYRASNFDQPINEWNVARVTKMNSMFNRADVFDQPLDGWNVSKVTDMSHMFRNVENFDQPVDGWNVASVTDMKYMFNWAESFDQPLNSWNVANVTTMFSMFTGTPFNQPINDWNVSKVNDMDRMFMYASNFDKPLDDWNVAKVTNMLGMFFTSKKFNQPVDVWNVAKVTGMKWMFNKATNFNQCISSWAEKTSSPITEIMLKESDCTIKLDPDPDVGPWCQGVQDGCVGPTSAPTTTLAPTSAPTLSMAPTSAPTSAPTASPTGACDNSAVFDCAKHVTGFKKRKCSKKIRKKWGVGLKFKDVCREMCKGQLCTCVDSVEKFSIKGVQGDHTCAGLIGLTNCKKFTDNGFGVNKICPNQCRNTKKCIK